MHASSFSHSDDHPSQQSGLCPSGSGRNQAREDISRTTCPFQQFWNDSDRSRVISISHHQEVVYRWSMGNWQRNFSWLPALTPPTHTRPLRWSVCNKTPFVRMIIIELFLAVMVQSIVSGCFVRFLQCWLRRYYLLCQTSNIFYPLLFYKYLHCNRYVRFTPNNHLRRSVHFLINGTTARDIIIVLTSIFFHVYHGYGRLLPISIRWTTNLQRHFHFGIPHWVIVALLFLRKSCLVTIRQLSIHGNVGTSFLWSDILPDQNQLGLGKRHWIWQPLQTYISSQHSVHSSYFQVLGSSVRYSPTRSELVSCMDCSSAGSTFQDRSPISTEHCMLVPFYFA